MNLSLLRAQGSAILVVLVIAAVIFHGFGKSSQVFAQEENPHRVWGGIHVLTAQEMQDAYGTAAGLGYLYSEEISTRWQYRVGTGILAAEGTPHIKSSTEFDVRSSQLHLISIPLEFSVRRTLGGIRGNRMLPYAGLGFGGQFGWEILQAELADVLFLTRWHETSFRTSWSGHLVMGTEMSRVRHRPFVEVRWVVAGRSSDLDGLSGDKRAQADDGLYDAVARPDGRLTGWQVRLGMSF